MADNVVAYYCDVCGRWRRGATIDTVLSVSCLCQNRCTRFEPLESNLTSKETAMLLALLSAVASPSGSGDKVWVVQVSRSISKSDVIDVSINGQKLTLDVEEAASVLMDHTHGPFSG